MTCNNNSPQLDLTLPDRCCTANTGCEFDGTLRRVKAEPIYVQKVYDAALFNLQGLRTIAGQEFKPDLGKGARIIRVLDIRCKKFFNPSDINDERNLIVRPTTTISGAEFVEDGKGNPVTVIGPDGTASEKILYADTRDCDEEGKGTPIFGTQNIEITGNVVVEIDVLFTDDCDKKCRATLSANVPIARPNTPLLLTNFFELCMPSVFNTAFLPRFTEFCNINCETRLATNSIMRDIIIDPETGEVKVNLIIALCVTCEKKIVVPVQLCVLSTGFPVLSAETAPICSTFPQLFPDQIDSKCPCRCAEEAEATEKCEE
ncbi:hypothetical protein FQB35_08060 [Crassaminicella thermophila]|uniref:Uncharacterized protein n=1 Tax=Crassaminicella thermophila TaxID=2599308 RepID=A0A5C0SCU2_CRATE|nr:hypothetical protein [Crassaminicella thermophila]QEK12333.1 hypothetical protein FQB35_08060 [Crassaminicella thermophila]